MTITDLNTACRDLGLTLEAGRVEGLHDLQFRGEFGGRAFRYSFVCDDDDLAAMPLERFVRTMRAGIEEVAGRV